ncbi:MAG: AAA family ATPase [Planctomycetes bacterium]|nr:AAA family ATPase [Planctomycetota bacterium]
MESLKQLLTALRAGYPYLYVETNEINETVNSIVDTVENYQNVNGDKIYWPALWDFEKSPDPEQVLLLLEESAKGTVVVAKNFNWFLKKEYEGIDKAIVSALQNNSDIYSSRDYRKALIIVSNESFGSAIPKEINKDFFPVQFEPASRSEIERIYDSIVDGAKDNPKFKNPSEEEKQIVIDSALGMTRRDCTNALAYSIIDDGGELKAKTVSKLKAKDIEKTAGIKFGDYPDTFKTLKGYEVVKDFVLGTIKSPLSKGIMLLGPPGTGKTKFSRCIGNEVGLPVFEMECAELFGGLVGDSEKLWGELIRFITANAPCILLIDEIEKGFAGAGGSRSGSAGTDGGTTTRSTSQFLKFLSDGRPEGIYVIATCNDISALPPEWVRPGRWDTSPFFVDLPNDEEKVEILEYYKELHGVVGTPADMHGWAGAEIEAVCRISKMRSETIGEAARWVIPNSVTMGDEIKSLRKWAEKRTISASTTIKRKKARAVEL